MVSSLRSMIGILLWEREYPVCRSARVSHFRLSIPSILRLPLTIHTLSRSGPSSTSTYSYDAIGHLETSQRNGSTTRFSYDALGNRSKMNTSSGTSSYSYDANSGRMLTSANTPSGNFTFSYDDNGNLKTRVGPSSTATYTYDTLNHLTGIVQGGSTLATYSYNGAGQRVGKVAGGVTSSYLWDGGNLAQENRGGTSYLYSYLGANPVAMTNLTGTSSSQVFEMDLLGSILGAVNASGTELVQYDPDDFGNSLGQYGASANPFGFGGAFYDSESGLYQMRGRYYDPSLGRFLTVDINPGNPYSYCGNNPVSRADPSGWMWYEAAGRMPPSCYRDIQFESSKCKIIYAITPDGRRTAVASYFPEGSISFLYFEGWEELWSGQPGWNIASIEKCDWGTGTNWEISENRYGRCPLLVQLLQMVQFENSFFSYLDPSAALLFTAIVGAIVLTGLFVGAAIAASIGVAATVGAVESLSSMLSAATSFVATHGLEIYSLTKGVSTAIRGYIVAGMADEKEPSSMDVASIMKGILGALAP